MKKLPIGVQSFEEIRTGNYYYVDKTYFVHRLVNSGKYYFLSRPRRFGKSLFLDTIKQAFLGRKELFEGLFLENNWDWSTKYPVIHISFGKGVYSTSQHLETYIKKSLLMVAELYDVNLEVDYPDIMIDSLIWNIYRKYKQKVVVLIDEYDKPILDNIADKELAKQNREILKNLYSPLKDADQYIKFVMLTGVSKFSKVSIFSGLNQLNDITIDKEYSAICGYTEKELMEVFKPELEGEDIEEIRNWYNGYSFCGDKVYNPFDILLYLSKKDFKPFWFETGTPEFLAKLIMDRRFNLPDLENLPATDDLIGSFDLDFIEPEPLLFQSGYLTIKQCESSFDGVLYYLTYPNKEVKISLNRYLVRYLTNNSRIVEYVIKVRNIFKDGDVQQLEEVLKSLFASIPNDWYRKNRLSEYEGYYASVVYSFLASTGLTLIAEDNTNKGRIDLTVIYDDKVYILEFKIAKQGRTEERALSQIKKKEYYRKYEGTHRDIYLIGIEFSREERNIHSFEWEKYR